jgi:hypothetical protein
MLDYAGSPITVLNTKTERAYTGMIVSISDKAIKISATDNTIKLNQIPEGLWCELNTGSKFRFL